MNVIFGVFFVCFGVFSIARPEKFITASRGSGFRLGLHRRLDDTAYGRWWARIEPTWIRIVGGIFVAFGVALAVGLI